MKRIQRGMSLVEILVAVAIGLIGILIIMQAYITSDKFNRSTLGAGGAQAAATLHVGPGAGTACATGGCPIYFGEVNNISDTSLSMFQNQGGASALGDPVLLIFGIPNDSGSGTAANAGTITGATLYSPYPGGTTSYEALWMGVPILTMRGDKYISHLGESIMHHAGLPDWVAADEDDYVAKAVAFASDLESVAGLRAGLRQQVLASPLFDAPLFARSIEDALWGMWQVHSEGDSSPSPERLAAFPD